MRILLALIVSIGIAFLSAHADQICSPYSTFYDQCTSSDCTQNKGTGPTISILRYDFQMQGYEFPSKYHVGQTYLLNAYVPNDNYCKKTTTIAQEYQNYKSKPDNYTSTKYEDLKFSYIVQISKLDANAKTTYLNTFDGVAKPGDKQIHTFEWVPQEEGQYKIERFIFYDVEKPIPLAPLYTKYVSVSGEEKQPPRFLSPVDLYIYGMSLKGGDKNKEMVTAIKSSNGMPVVVTKQTKETLIERGWARPT